MFSPLLAKYCTIAALVKKLKKGACVRFGTDNKPTGKGWFLGHEGGLYAHCTDKPRLIFVGYWRRREEGGATARNGDDLRVDFTSQRREHLPELRSSILQRATGHAISHTRAPGAFQELSFVELAQSPDYAKKWA